MDTAWRGPILRGVLKYLFKSVITRAVTPRWCALQCPGLLYGGAAQPRKAFLGTTQPLGWCFLFSASEFTKHFLIFFTFLSQNVSRVPIYRWQGRRWNQVPFPRSRNPASLGSSWAVMGEFWKLPSLLVSFFRTFYWQDSRARHFSGWCSSEAMCEELAGEKMPPWKTHNQLFLPHSHPSLSLREWPGR